MNILIKVLRAIGLITAALLAVWLYRSGAATDSSKDVADPAQKVRLLARADRIYPLNDRTCYELGRAYFDLGLRNLGQSAKSVRDFQSAIGFFRRSLELNPFSPFAHFQLAQALFYVDAASSGGDGGPFKEYRLAAETAGRNSQVFFDVGIALLSRWKDLSDSEKLYAATTLRTSLAGGSPERLQILFSTWELDVLDYGIMDKLLPEESEIYHAYARYLGERSLSLERRQQALAKAEYLQLGKARTELDAGENALFNYRVAESMDHFRTCFAWLGNIMFYQDLTGQRLFDPEEYANIEKSTRLDLIKAGIELGASLKDVASDLDEYLDLENRPAAVGELDAFLLEKGLTSKDPEKHLDDLETLDLELRLYFVQSRYQEIVRVGRVLVQSVVVVPPEKRDAYVRILCLLGDAQQKVDNLYDAGDFYRKALDLDPENLDVLIKLRQNCRLLSNDQKAKEIQARILAAVSRRSSLTGVAEIPKGEDFEHFLVLEGGDTPLGLVFEEAPKDPLPLITVVFNRRVIWDGYVRGPVLSVFLKARVGRNRIDVIAVNRPVKLARLDLKPAGPGILP
jgi:tetratricopeptide (TPR) repeat protein